MNRLDSIKDKVLPILRKHKVTKAGIFGSYARGEQKKNSDVDILVQIEDPEMGLIGFIQLKDLLKRALKKNVDLVEYECIRKELKKSILHDEVRILS
ncbi:nucleotidyltransferase domain-containing protein [Candidatus Pacearchaeota archaeon]|nr:nucleotidyltransferase domain-containing protein [Candidatus Pacearchaeota archaeon]